MDNNCSENKILCHIEINLVSILSLKYQCSYKTRLTFERFKRFSTFGFGIRLTLIYCSVRYLSYKYLRASFVICFFTFHKSSVTFTKMEHHRSFKINKCHFILSTRARCAPSRPWL